MFKGLAWLHAQLFRLCLWLLALPFKALWSFLIAVLLLLGEEVRRWLGIAMSGLLIFLAGRATLNYAPPGIKRPLVMVDLVLVLVWALAAKRAAHYTLHNNLRLVRQRLWFRELTGTVRDLRGDLAKGMARATRGTMAGRVFASNRDADAQAEAEARAAEAQAQAERRAAAAEAARWSAEQVAARRAEAAAQDNAVLAKGGYRVV